MSTSYAETAAEIAAVSKRKRDRVAELLAEADALSVVLEKLNLAGRKSVPADVRHRLLSLARTVTERDLTDRHKAICEAPPALEFLHDEVTEILFHWHAADTGNLEAFNANIRDNEP